VKVERFRGYPLPYTGLLKSHPHTQGHLSLDLEILSFSLAKIDDLFKYKYQFIANLNLVHSLERNPNQSMLVNTEIRGTIVLQWKTVLLY
jgi:hypothetical protein